MKKNKYAISIAMGVFIGAIVALMIGNTTTAILGGVVSAGFTAWIASLQWGEAKKFTTKVADKIDVLRHLEDIANLGYRAIIGTGKVVKWLLLAPIRLVIALATDVNARKTVLAVIAVLGITSAYVFFLFLSLTSSLHYGGESTGGNFLRIFLGISPALIIVIMSSVSMLTMVEISVKYGVLIPYKVANRRERECGNESFVLDWFYQLIQDDRGAVASIARMLYIRTGNALRILAYPFILVLWGAVALANNKTGVSALSAMILSGLHLAIAYLVGGINTGNANFWLSLAVAMGIGVAMGKKVSAMREPTARRPLPSIKFREQVEFHHS